MEIATESGYNESEQMQRHINELKKTYSEDKDLTKYLRGLGIMFERNYRVSGDLKHLDAAVRNFEKVVQLHDDTHPARARHRQNLATALVQRYQRLGNLETLEAAVAHNRKAVELALGDDRSAYIQSYAVSLMYRYSRLGDPKDLEDALQCHRNIVDLTPSNHPEKAGRLTSLAESSIDQYRKSGELKELQAALQYIEDAVGLTPSEHPERADRMGHLATVYIERYRRLGDLNDLETAIQYEKEAMRLTHNEHPGRARRLQQLGLSYSDRYRRLGNLEDLEAALRSQKEALELTPSDDPQRARRLHHMSVSFSGRYYRLSNLRDLELALQYIREAVALTPSNHPDRAEKLQSLAGSLFNRYHRLGELQDLEAALQYNKETVKLTQSNNPARAERVQNLGVLFNARHRRLGELDDLESSLQYTREAVELTAHDHAARGERMIDLATSFRDRFKRLGDLKDLNAALQYNNEAIRLTPNDHIARAGMLQSLALTLSDKYKRLANLKDLEDALQFNKEAVKLTPENHAARASRIRNLAVMFSDKYRRLGDLKDLEFALQYAKEAVELTPHEHSEKAGRLQLLAASFDNRYERLRDFKDLEIALQYYEEALELTPSDRTERASMVKSFAVALMNRFEKLGSMKDLVATLRYNAEAVKITPPGHPEYSERLQHFAASFAKRFMQLRDQEDLVCAHFLYNLSSAYKPSDPEFSWHSALSWADLAKRFQPEYCLRAFSVAFNLLPEVLWVGHSIPVRHDAVHRVGVGSATSNAVNTCLDLKNPTAAVEFMEQGLATVFQQMLQLKTDVDQLPAVQAKEFLTMSSQLYTRAFADLLELVVDRNNLLAEIRKQPDSESFLLPKSYKDLRNASQAGPVVILNAHEDACHAIIILTPSSEPAYFAIKVTVEQLEGQKTLMKKLLRRCHVRSGRDSGTSRLFGHMEEFSVKGTQECFTDFLTWIWTRIVQPVYQVLEAHGISKGRLWWLPTGAFISLPLHACPPTDHFVHSYTATLGSLIEARARKPSNMKSEVGIVGVSYTDSSGANYLRGVHPEVSNILAAIPKPLVKALENQSATPQAVKTQLQDCSWLHLACHGKQDLSQPTKSHLLLYEGRLELETILQMPLNNAEVVFLAACQTAMGDSQLVNESFHLGGGLITAGFRGAIGTTWAMNDQDGPIVAKTFYSHLFGDGRQPEATDAAEALHLAVKELRDNNVSYERWIPFIHMGV